MKKIILVKPTLNIPKSIAIIGSSKSILNKEQGDTIDEYDHVVRFNFAKINDYKKYVGSKVSLMVINNNCYEKLKDNNDYKDILVISPYKEKRINHHNFNLYFLEKKKLQYFVAVRFINNLNIFLKLIKLLKRNNFSVGFYFTLLSIASGFKPTLFGFDLSEDMAKRKHYYKEHEIGNVHNLKFEHEILRNLKDKKIIDVK